MLAGRRGDAGLPAGPLRPSRERRAGGGRGAAGTDGGVGRGAGPAAVRAGGGGEAGRCRGRGHAAGPPGQSLGCGGCAAELGPVRTGREMEKWEDALPP